MTPRLHILPRWAPMAATTLGSTDRIWVKAQHVNDDGVIEHEKVHLRQAQRDGSFLFLLRYLLPSWRVRYEAEAYATSVRHGASLAWCARVLSSGLYLWPCSEADAEAAILAHLQGG